MPTSVTSEQRRVAKQEMVKAVQQGVPTSVARDRTGISMHRATVYRFLKRLQSEGENALTDGRHGHPIKLRGEALAFVREHCETNPCVSSFAMQCLLQERLSLCISVSQLNRVRAGLGLTRKPVSREKKVQNQPDN